MRMSVGSIMQVQTSPKHPFSFWQLHYKHCADNAHDHAAEIKNINIF